MKRRLLYLLGLSLITTAFACGPEEDDGPTGPQPFADDCTTTIEPQDTPENSVREFNQAIMDVSDGGVICMLDGTYELNGQLTLNTGSGIEMRGQSQAGTILDFAGQSEEDGSGANGILAEGIDDIRFAEFTIKNTAGDAIKAQDADGVEMVNLTVDWDEGRNSNNGAYGLYPVLSTNVLVEGCTVRHASDAGIYLGQSDTAILRNNVAERNVAGIEIENTINAEVHGNTATENTGGVLIFNLPDLTMYGEGNKIHNNVINNNNGDNFASGGIVANVPEGTGIFILAMDGNEVHDNEIKDNNSIGIAILAYEGPLATLEGAPTDENYDTYAESNYVHDNVVSGNGTDPEGLLTQVLPDPPLAQMWLDWFVDTEKETPFADRRNCFMNNDDGSGGTPEFAIYELSLGGDPPPMPDAPTDCNADDWMDACHYQCEGEELPAVTLP
ncbi:MAG: parallel beta-helix domain-containing protein [Myxococcota bacterium]